MTTKITVNLQKILNATHHDPFCVLGKHRSGKNEVVRVFLPRAKQLSVVETGDTLKRIADTDIFEWRGTPDSLPDYYQLQWQDDADITHTDYDPYCFAPQLADFDLHLFNEGKHWHIYQFLGAHLHQVAGIAGVLFAVWAPNAQRVSVVGDFNHWDGRCHPMRIRGHSGVWELFIPGLAAGTLYKFEIRNRDTGQIYLKADPYGQGFEQRPRTASYVTPPTEHAWADDAWLQTRTEQNWLQQPLSIYEVHLGSWQRDAEGQFLNYRDLAHQLVPYVKQLQFTHIELMPIAEHPLDASWGYQTTGFFAPTARFGSADDFRYLVDYCHQHGLGVLLDWVPGHFPKDAHGLAQFDGTPLYEYADPKQGEHREWGTLVFNYGRHEVKNFLLANAVYWLQEFHLDGLRVDAVAAMLYLDYSRAEGEWLPNPHGGRENLEAIAFLQTLNHVTHSEFPGTLIMAEESTSWALVTRPTWLGGLGFSLKWNMGWMHDTLTYLSKDPIYRPYHHQHLTFGLLYAFSENFVLPLSHDEVVHGKRSLLDKMPGDGWQKFANLRLLFTYLWTYPGKKLLFMGGEFGQGLEWRYDKALDWYLLTFTQHQGIQTLVTDLNGLYQQLPALHQYDFEGQGFYWIDCHDASQSVLAYARRSDTDIVVIVLNFTPVPRHGYRIGVPAAGEYVTLLNSDSRFYGGSDVGNAAVTSEAVAWMGFSDSVCLSLPPLGGVVLQLVNAF